MVRTFTRRRVLGVAGGLGAAAGLVACRAGVEGRSSGEEGELSLWIVDHDGTVRELLEDEIIPAFERDNQGYRVNLRFSGWERYAEEVTTAFTGGLGPDVYQGGAVWVGQQVARGWALPLTGYVEQAGAWDWDDFIGGARDDVVAGDEIYAVPYRVSPRTLWYRTDHLGEEGFDQPPATWEQLREVANATVRREDGRITREGFDTYLGGGPAWQGEMQTYWDFMHAAGGQFLADDLGRCLLDQPPAVEALTFLHDLIVQDQVMPYPSFEDQGELSALELGLTATGMHVELPDLRVREYAPDQVEFVKAAPPLRHAQQATQLYVNKYFISSQTADPDGSWLLLQHLTAAGNLEAYAAAGAYLTPRASLAEADYLNENMKTIARAGQTAIPYPRHENMLELFRPVSENLDRCFRGQLSPQEAMARTTEEVNALL